MTNRDSKNIYTDSDSYINEAFFAWSAHDEDGRPEIVEPEEYLYEQDEDSTPY